MYFQVLEVVAFPLNQERCKKSQMYALFITESKALVHDNKGFRQIQAETSFVEDHRLKNTRDMCVVQQR